MSRRCLICANINPCRQHSDADQRAELARNDAEIAEIRARQAMPNNPPLASVRAREAAARLHENGSSAAAMWAEGTRRGDYDAGRTVQAFAAFERQLLDEIEGRVKGLVEADEILFCDCEIVLAAIQELRHG